VNHKVDFPIFKHHPELVYLDSAATSQKPQVVIQTVTDFYKRHNSNVHRGLYGLAQTAEELYEGTRQKLAEFIGARSSDEIILTSNASTAINLVALGYAEKYLREGDVIVTSQMEHHSNFVPWVQLAKQKKLFLYVLPLDAEYHLDFRAVLDSGWPLHKIKLVALTHASNVLGTINPIAEIIASYKSAGITAKLLIDGAQSAPHLPIDVQKLDCDFFAFSSHKMLGPSGVGVLWGRGELLKNIDPVFVGSHMIAQVSKDDLSWAEAPAKFEVGTGNIEGVVGLGAAVEYLNKIGMSKLQSQEKELVEYGLKKLTQVEGLTLYGATDPANRLAMFSFGLAGIHPHDIAEILSQNNICVRAGDHCARPLMRSMNVPGTVRASLYLYNTTQDIDQLVEGIEKVKKVFNSPAKSSRPSRRQ
jgi:cysteine desulfurase / selenocysteine lyase